MERKSFNESERQCETSFAMSGNWFHLFTSGRETTLFLKTDDDYRYCMNLMARCAVEFHELVIVAFAIMGNHIHIVLSGECSVFIAFFHTFRRRLSRYLFAKYKESVPSSFQLAYKKICDLKSLRNTIVYVNRNGYVANPAYTPFSYPWSTGTCFFNVNQGSVPVSSLTIDGQRALFKGRVPAALQQAELTDGFVSPNSYCSISFGMALFRDAHHYFNMICKNMESYSELATDLDDGEFLTDPEMFSEVLKILDRRYAGVKLKSLSNAQKNDLARVLHFQYHSSNGQIRRILGISQYDIDQLFTH